MIHAYADQLPICRNRGLMAGSSVPEIAWRVRGRRPALHPEMSASVIVSPSSYFAETDQILGDYFIANVPDGEYKAFVRHEGKPETSQVIKVAGNTKMDFSAK